MFVRSHARPNRRFARRPLRVLVLRPGFGRCERRPRKVRLDETEPVLNRHIESGAHWYKRWLMETSGSASRPLRLGFPKSRVGPSRRATPAVAPLTTMGAPPPSEDFAVVSSAMRQVYALIRQLAPTDVTLTLTGETG